MTTTRIKATVPLLALAALATLTLSACGGEDDQAADNGDEVVTDSTVSDTSDDSGSDDGTEGDGADDADDSGDDATGATFPGTGQYAIGVDIPLGGFQILGEPASQPDGCTWSIVDEEGAVYVENQGVYVFLTDIPEAVTFITDGCPDWEQFE